MKTLTQVVLPIAALAGLVFGITYILNYSSSSTSEKKTDGGKDAGKLALKFNTILVQKDPNPNEVPPHLKHWRGNYEIGEAGHYDFWFKNENDQPVSVTFATATCKCAGAELGIVPAAAKEQWVGHAAAVGLACLAELPLKVEWKDLSLDGKEKGTVPAATAAGPQLGAVRVKWDKRQNDQVGEKSIGAGIVAQIAGASPNPPVELKMIFHLTQPFDVYGQARVNRIVGIGDLVGPNAVAERPLFVASRTRPNMNLRLEAQNADQSKEFIACSTPTRLSKEEMAQFAQNFPEAGDALSVYRFMLTVRERQEVEREGSKVMKKLDLGPIDFNLKVQADADESKSQDESKKVLIVPVHGVVRGEVRLVGSQSLDRIDFGSSFSSAAARSTQVTVESGPEINLEVDRTACMPDYLEITLTREATKDDKSKKLWSLRVSIPAGKLYGNLTDAFVVLKATGAQDRRIRIPVKASTFDGGPRF